MQFTAKEERLVIRSRKTWYKFSKFLVIILALIGTVLGTTIVAIMSANLEDRHQYQEQLTQLANLAERDSLPNEFIPATKYESITEAVSSYTKAYVSLLDSLELSDKVIGTVFHLNISPTGVEGWRYGTSQMDVFTSCGCDQEGFFALHTLEVNPTTMSASVVSSEESMRLADYRNRQRHSLNN